MVASKSTLIIEDFNRSLQLDGAVEIDLTEAMITYTPSTKEESAFSTLRAVSRATMDISHTTLDTNRNKTMITREEEAVKCAVEGEGEETSFLATISTHPSTLESITTTRPTSLDTTIIKSRKIADIITTTSSLLVEGTLEPEECAPCPIINPTLKCMSVGSM
jgi:hypothetical protein